MPRSLSSTPTTRSRTTLKWRIGSRRVGQTLSATCTTARKCDRLARAIEAVYRRVGRLRRSVQTLPMPSPGTTAVSSLSSRRAEVSLSSSLLNRDPSADAFLDLPSQVQGGSGRLLILYGWLVGPLLAGYMLFDKAFAYIHLPGRRCTSVRWFFSSVPSDASLPPGICGSWSGNRHTAPARTPSPSSYRTAGFVSKFSRHTRIVLEHLNAKKCHPVELKHAVCISWK